MWSVSKLTLNSQDLVILHETYGSYVRIGPNEVSISDYQLYRQIYNHTSSVKEDSFYKASKLIGHENMFTMRLVQPKLRNMLLVY